MTSLHQPWDSKVISRLILWLYGFLFLLFSAGGLVAQNLKIEEPPLPDLTGKGWAEVRKERKTLQDYFNIWGFTFELQPLKENKGTPFSQPGFVNVSSGWNSNKDELNFTIDFGFKDSTDAIVLQGTFKGAESSDNTKISGKGKIAIKGYGMVGGYTYDDKVGFTWEGGVELEHLIYTVGAKIDTNDKVTADFALKLGPAIVKFNPQTYYQRAKHFIAEGSDATKKKLRGVSMRFDAGALTAAMSSKPPKDSSLYEEAWLVSLKRLLPLFQSGRQLDLGPLTKITGVIIDEENDDVILVGRSEEGMVSFNTDLLVAAFKVILRDEMNPAVSIDPSPKGRLVSHKARLIGFADDLTSSALARDMLEADFLAKKIIFGVTKAKVKGYRSAHDIVSEFERQGREHGIDPEMGLTITFIPDRPELGDIWEARRDSQAIYLFDTRVKLDCRIERTFASGKIPGVDGDHWRTLTSKGKTPSALPAHTIPAFAQSCLSWNHHYSKLIRRHKKLQRLNQAFEAVQLASILREANITTTTMDDWLALPARNVEVRKVFPIQISNPAGPKGDFFYGGVEMRYSVERSRMHFADELTSRLDLLQSRSWDGPFLKAEGLFQPILQKASLMNKTSQVHWLMQQAQRLTDDDNQSGAYQILTEAIELDPGNALALTGRSFILSRLQRFEEAIEDANEAIAEEPDYGKAYLRRGHAKLELDRFEEAVDDFTKAVIFDGRLENAHVGRGTAYQFLENYEQSVIDLSKAVEINPRNPFSRGLLAYSKMKLKDYEGAIDDYSAAIQMGPLGERDWFYTERAYLRKLTADYEGAAADIDKALEFTEGDLGNLSWVYKLRGEIYSSSGATDKAAADFTESIRLDPLSAKALAGRANFRNSSGNPQGALEDAEAAIALDPEHVDAWMALAVAKSRLADNGSEFADPTPLKHGLDIAYDLLTKKIKKDPKDELAFFKRGMISTLLLDFSNAHDNFGMVVKLNPKFPDVYSFRSFLRELESDIEGAIADVELGLTLLPRSNKMRARLAELKGILAKGEAAPAKTTEQSDYDKAVIETNRGQDTLRRGLNKEAIAHYDRAVELDPTIATTYRGRGLAKSLLGRNFDAFIDLSYALELDPNHAAAYAGRGWAKYNLGAYAWAIEDIQKGIELDPSKPVVHGNLAFAWEKLAEQKPERAKFFLQQSVVSYLNAQQQAAKTLENEDWIDKFLAETQAKLDALD